MKIMRRLAFILIPILAMVSCIKDEPQNAEADILSCVVLNKDLEPDTENIRGNIIYTNDRIVINAFPTIDPTNIALDVELTDGATISPDPKTVADYSQPREFTVTSEDGNWQKVYTIVVDIFDLPTKYSFEDYEYNSSNKYYVFYSSIMNGTEEIKQYIWASGNPGYGISGIAKTPEDYPTVNVARSSGGRMACLTTRSTGVWGALLNMPLAGGNLFIGSFDSSIAVTAPMESTKFGVPFSKKPIKLTGEYYYQSGTEFMAGVDENKQPQIINYADSCEIYAVLYESEGLKNNSLNGLNTQTSKNIVAIARLKDIKVSATSDVAPMLPVLEKFEVDFDYNSTQAAYWPSFIDRDSQDDNKGILQPFDIEKAKSYRYNLAVIFSSSRYAAYFAGAENSVLYIDNVEVVSE